jgi:RimJ/RimL family protein N-acetyltransferase
MGMHLALTTCELRSWQASDLESLVRYANNRNIWLNLRDRFPHPYTLADAEAYIASVMARPVQTSFGIVVDGVVGGNISLHPGTDIERISAELGYWLGRPFWGRGIITEAVQATTRYGFEELKLRRVFSVPLARNVASARVLEKCGFVPEGLMRRSAIKDGRILDQHLFAAYDDRPRT